MTPSPRPPDRLAVDFTVRIGLLILFAAVIAALVHPFLSVLIWSVILTVTLNPVYLWIRDHIGGNGLVAAVLVTALSLALILGPIGILSASVVESALRIAEAAKDRTLDLSALPFDVSNLPVVGPELEKDLSEATGDTGTFLKHYGHTMLVPSEWLLKFVAGLAGSTLVFAIAVVASGFLFVPAPKLVQALYDIATKVVGPKGSEVVALATATIRSVSRGIVGVAVLQALVFGTVTLVFGVPHAGLLTIVVLVLAIVQIGCGVVVLPLFAWLWFSNDLPAALLFFVSVLPVFALEHLLKPVALARGIKTPMLVIALGVFGGLVAFGLPGLFIGPVALAVFYEMVVFWVWPDRIATETRIGDSPDP